MISHLNRTVLSVPALVALMGSILGVTSYAATVFGGAHPEWVIGLKSGSMIYTDPVFDKPTFDSFVVSFNDHSPESAALQILQINLVEKNRGSVLGDGSVTNSWGDFDSSASAGVSSRMASYDPQAALAWLYSMGDPSEARNEALRSLVETWTGNPYTGDSASDFIGEDRSRVRRDGSRVSWNLVPASDLAAIPEPSSALLGALGGLFLLRRRRTS